jgi:hypothetical protein
MNRTIKITAEPRGKEKDFQPLAFSLQPFFFAALTPRRNQNRGRSCQFRMSKITIKLGQPLSNRPAKIIP